MGRKHYELLDGVRGIAAIAIMYRHMDHFGVHSPAQSYLGVDLFFILSGAVIANAYEARLCAGMAFRDFFSRRLVRLYPMIVMGLAVGTLNVLYGDREDVRNVWLAVSLALVVLPNTPLLNLGAIDGPGWSLSYELVANSVYAAGLYRQSTRRLMALVGVFALVLVAAAIYKGHLDTGNSAKSIPFGFARVGFSFLSGVILFRLHKAGRFALPAWLTGSWGVAFALLLLAASLLTNPIPALRPVVSLVTVFLLLPAIVVVGLECRPPPVLSHVSKVLGAISYPLYLVHAPLASLIAVQMVRHGQSAHLMQVAVLFGPMVAAMAWALDRYYDEPVRKALTRRIFTRSLRPALA